MYYGNNVTGSANLMEVMMEFGVKKIVFSSSATVYGECCNLKIFFLFNYFAQQPIPKPWITISRIVFKNQLVLLSFTTILVLFVSLSMCCSYFSSRTMWLVTIFMKIWNSLFWNWFLTQTLCLTKGTFIKDVPFFCHLLRYLPLSYFVLSSATYPK